MPNVPTTGPCDLSLFMSFPRQTCPGAPRPQQAASHNNDMVPRLPGAGLCILCKHM